MPDTKDESLLKFPCEFPIKVMGKATPEFEEAVHHIVLHTFPTIDLTTISKRYSKDHHYLSLTITVHAESRAQLDKIYRELTACTDVLMAL